MRGSKTAIFGMITVSLDVKIVNVFVFTECNLSAFETTLALSTLCHLYWVTRSPSDPSPQVQRCSYSSVYLTCSESESPLELSFPKESCFPVFLSWVSTMKDVKDVKRQGILSSIWEKENRNAQCPA